MSLVASGDRTWANASLTNGDRTIAFRFVHELGAARPERQPARVFVIWRFDSEDGTPDPAQRERMNQLEELLSVHLESDGFATLVIVSTGDGLREWTYYAESSPEFLSRLNLALAGLAPFPIEIHEAEDAAWDYYARFVAALGGLE